MFCLYNSFIGRRDILGAAETGSGKTLAFGLPILTGIMKLKEKAELKGLDVYDIPFKKTSVKKRKDVENKKEKINGKDRRNNQKNNEKKVESENVKESSEDGYSSGDGNESLSGGDVDEENNDSDFIEEIEVPLRKPKESEEDDLSDEDYVHLSDMLESDDLESDENDEDEVSDGEDYDENDDEQNNDVSDDEENSGIDEVDIANGGNVTAFF